MTDEEHEMQAEQQFKHDTEDGYFGLFKCALWIILAYAAWGVCWWFVF